MNPHQLANRLVSYAAALRRLVRYGGPAEKDLSAGAAALCEAVVMRLMDRRDRRKPPAVPSTVRGLLAELWERESLDLLGVLADYASDLPPHPPARTTAPAYPLPASPWSVIVVDPAGDVAAAELPAVSALVGAELTAQERAEIAAKLRRLADSLTPTIAS